MKHSNVLAYCFRCRVMGRELTNVNMDKNPFGVTLKPTSHNKVHVAPKISEGNNNEAKDYDVKKNALQKTQLQRIVMITRRKM